MLYDIFTHQIKTYLLQASMLQADVKAIWEDLLRAMPATDKVLIRVRSDNGSQFAAKSIRSFFAAQGIHHKYWHVAMPRSMDLLNPFTALLSGTGLAYQLVSRHQWKNLAELADLMSRYIYFYNEPGRRSGAIAWKFV